MRSSLATSACIMCSRAERRCIGSTTGPLWISLVAEAMPATVAPISCRRARSRRTLSSATGEAFVQGLQVAPALVDGQPGQRDRGAAQQHAAGREDEHVQRDPHLGRPRRVRRDLGDGEQQDPQGQPQPPPQRQRRLGQHERRHPHHDQHHEQAQGDHHERLGEPRRAMAQGHGQPAQPDPDEHPEPQRVHGTVPCSMIIAMVSKDTAIISWVARGHQALPGSTAGRRGSARPGSGSARRARSGRS